MKSTLIFLALGTVCIMTSQSFSAGKSARAPAGEIQIEISLTGIIEKTPDVSNCMDGALYQIKHVIGKDGFETSRRQQRITVRPPNWTPPQQGKGPNGLQIRAQNPEKSL